MNKKGFRFFTVKKWLPKQLNFWAIAKTLNCIFWINSVLWLFVHTLPLSIGILSKKIFDNMVLKNDFMGFIQLIGCCFTILFINICFIYIGAYVDIQYKLTLKKELYTSVLESLSSPYKDYHQIKGKILDSLNTDVEIIVNTISYFIDMFANMCLTVLSITILGMINFKLTVVMTIPIFATVIISILSKQQLSVLSKSNRGIEQEISSAAYSFVDSYEMIKMMGMERHVIERIISQNNIKRDIDLKKARLVSVIGTLNQITGDLTVAFLLLFITNPLKNEFISIGDFTLFVFYSRHIIEFTTVYLSSYLVKKRQADISIANLNEILKESVIPFTEDDPFVQNITDKLLDNNIYFLELLGKNGSGKTYMAERVFYTILKNKKIAMLSQKPMIFNESIRKNIVLNNQYERERFYLVISMASLDEDEFVTGFESPAGNKGTMLSGGQVFRIALARLLYSEPYYIIIDGGLNSVEEYKREKIIYNLYSMYRGRVLFTTNLDINYEFIENKEIIIV